jgi:hypothetical protein
MNRFVLYEEVVEEKNEEGEMIKKYKVMAELIKFRNGKVAASFLLQIPSVFIFDNIDQFTSLYCNDKVKLQHIPDKEPEKEV